MKIIENITNNGDGTFTHEFSFENTEVDPDLKRLVEKDIENSLRKLENQIALYFGFSASAMHNQNQNSSIIEHKMTNIS